ncbi:MAG: transposase [Verrucomicrobiota bacterium]
MQRRRFNAQQWETWLAEFDQSGLTVLEFCKQIGVATNSYYLWKRKLRPKGEPEAQPEFVPLEIHQAQVSEARIELPGKAVLHVPNDTASLRPIVEVLLAVEKVNP